MAYRPCTSCGNRFQGRAEYTYLTWYRGEEKVRVRLSDCAECGAELRNGLLERADTWADGDWVEPEKGLAPLRRVAS